MLLGLLLFLNWYLPGAPPPAFSAQMDRSTIRIHSNRKWPEAVKIDTSVPIIATAPAAPDTADSAAPGGATLAGGALPAGVKNAYASEPSPAHAASAGGRRHTRVARTASTRKARRFASYRQPEPHDWFLASW